MDTIREIVAEGRHQEEAIATREAIRNWMTKAVLADPGFNRINILLDKTVHIRVPNKGTLDDVIYYYVVNVKWSPRNDA